MDFKKDREGLSEEELKAIKKKERIFDHFWTLEEQQTILGLLKGRKLKKELKNKLEKEKGEKGGRVI